MRDILTPLFFFRRRAALAFILPLIAALFAAMLAPKIYVADTRLLILLGDDYVSRSTLGAALPGLTFDRSQIVKAETEIIGSRELALQTVQAVGVAKLYPRIHGPTAVEMAASQFSKDLTIENIPQSNVVAISLRNGDAQVAAYALNKLVAFYLDRRRGIFEQTNQVSVDQQTRAIGDQLIKLEKQLAAFSQEHGFGDFQLELTSTNTEEVQIKTQLAELERQLADRTGRASQLQSQQGANPKRVELSADYSRSLSLDGLEQSLIGLENQRRDAAQEYVDGSPIVKDFDERIAKVKAQIAATEKQQVNASRQGVNPIRQDIDQRLSVSEADLAGLKQARARAQDQLDVVDKRLAELIALAPQYRQLARQRDLLDAAATDLAKRGEETRLASSLSRTQANVRVLQTARPPIEGRTGRPFIFLAGAIIGVIAAASVVVLSVALFQGMLTPNDVAQKLATPVILTLNNAPEKSPLPVEGGLPEALYMSSDDSKVLGHLLRSIAPGAHCSLQFIGSDLGVGVTSLVVDFAIHAARQKQRVLVLDMEPQWGRSVSETLMQRGAELIDAGDGRYLNKVAGMSLFVTKPLTENRPVLTERDWEEVLSETSKSFDLVLVDAPPLTRSWIGLFAGPAVDVTLVVVEAEQTRAPVALNAIERIGGVGGEVAAAIFNKRRFYIPRSVYSRL